MTRRALLCLATALMAAQTLVAEPAPGTSTCDADSIRTMPASEAALAAGSMR